MSAWTALSARANVACLRVFGEPCTLTVQGAEHAVTGIFSAPRPGSRMGGVSVQPQEPALRVRSADLTALGELAGALVQVRERNFEVARALPGADDLTEFELRELHP